VLWTIREALTGQPLHDGQAWVYSSSVTSSLLRIPSREGSIDEAFSPLFLRRISPYGESSGLARDLFGFALADEVARPSRGEQEDGGRRDEGGGD